MINQQVYTEILWYVLHSVYEETRVVVGQIMAASPEQCTGSQYPKYMAVTGQEKQHYTETTSQFIWSFSFPFLFPKLKEIIKRTRFEGMKATKSAIMTEQRGIPEESFQQCIEAWQRKMGKSIRLEGDYFEGETM